MLAALLEPEAERAAAGCQDLFYVWAIVDQAYALSSPLQQAKSPQEAAVKVRHDRIKALAEAGSEAARNG